ncbi:hypothetical protein [Mycobacteroides abscessus]|uniref:hypothetical protein n=1 Tax=Mycobacteroides abscessus TaxID=36809 RepID=UPI00092BDB26|nr:hypothetical protein [Mycobacteroides abscessus]SIE20213.1 Uncharacterised protein [Mycobacteroides abscessus subsp. abscessus]
MTWLDWLGVIPTAAIVSALITLLLRWFDRPRAVLRLEARLTPNRGESSGVGDGPTQVARVALINAGDGDAFDVKVFGSKCDPAIELEPSNWGYAISVVKAGESVIVGVGANVDPAKTRGAALIVTWSPHPGRWRRKRLRVEVAELGLAELLPPGLLPVCEIPARIRRTQALEARSPRAQLYLQTPGVVHPLSTLEPPAPTPTQR